MAFGMYNGVVNTYFSIGNWKRGFRIETMTEDPDFQKVDKENESERILPGVRKGSESQVPLHSRNDLKTCDGSESFWNQDTRAVNAISFLSCLETPYSLFIAAGMDGYVRLFDSFDGTLRGQFDAGHVDVHPRADGTHPRLPVLTMAADPSQSMIATADNSGSIRTFELSTVTDEVIRFRLSVICAEDLIGADADGLSDPYVKIFLKAGPNVGQQEEKTKHVAKTLNPVWDEEFKFIVGRGKRDDIMKHHWKLDLNVFDYDRFGSHDLLGLATVDVHGLEFGKQKNMWVNLSDPEPAEGAVPKPHGRILIEVCLDVEFNTPDLFAAWKAHDDAVLDLQLVKPSDTIEGSRLPTILSVSTDRKIKAWTTAGILIGIFGENTWDAAKLKVLNEQSVEKKALLLLGEAYEQKFSDSLTKKKGGKLPEPNDYVLPLGREKRFENENADRQMAEESAEQSYVKKLENSEDVNDRIKAITKKMGIPANMYEGASALIRDAVRILQETLLHVCAYCFSGLNRAESAGPGQYSQEEGQKNGGTGNCVLQGEYFRKV